MLPVFISGGVAAFIAAWVVVEIVLFPGKTTQAERDRNAWLDQQARNRGAH